MPTTKNPILPGFHPDPSIIRVGQDYYVATSTFEWYPGVCIYHSKDLVNWTLVSRPLSTTTLLDMRGNPDSCGVWAPCLTVKDGLFYLAFTNTKRFAGDFKDTPNYFTVAANIGGPWSDPIYVNSSGFDPSLFHDDDGKSYWLNMIWDHRPVAGRNNFSPNRFFGGVVCQEINLDKGELLGKPSMIYKGSNIGLTEGPHIHKKKGYYYLTVAEGGTGKDHAVTIARAEQILGDYVTAPNNPIVTSANAAQTALKRAGHGDWCDTPDGKTVLVHLCSRPLPYRGRSVMGRETALQFLSWTDDDWPYLSHGGQQPSIDIDISSEPRVVEERIDFSVDPMPDTYHSLRYPLPNSIAYQTDSAFVLKGQESIGSWFEQSLLARRQQQFCFTYETTLDFAPTSFQQMAGLTCYYNSKKYYYLHVTHDEERGRVIDLSMCLNNWHSQYPLDEPISIPASGKVSLKAMVDHDAVRFAYRIENEEWVQLGLTLDYSLLSDEVGDGGADANFTGSFVGICCQDLTGQQLPASFFSVAYKESKTQ